LICGIFNVFLDFRPILIRLSLQELISNLNLILVLTVLDAVIDLLFKATVIGDAIDVRIALLWNIDFVNN